MKITFVVSYLEVTGGHRAVLEIATRLVGRGHDVTLLYPARSILSRRNAVLRRLGRAVPERLFIHNTAKLDWYEFPGRIVRAVDLLPSAAPPADAVVATAWQTAERVARFPTRAGRRFYFLQHYETWSGPAARVDATWRADFVRIASSDWLRRLAAERFGLQDVHVIPYGVDLDCFRPEPSGDARPGGPLRVGFMYHVEAWTGVADAVAVLDAVSRERAVEAVAFGVFAPGRDLPDDIEYHRAPSRDELRRIYNSLDVFLCASWTETGPMTVPEAMACGTCVVTTDVGNVELWSHGGAGAVIVPPRDHDALVDALAAVLDDPEARRRTAERGREGVQEFTWDRATEAFEEIFERSP
jgi:glycosyltransferase involved in cell wall biosynthesis